MTNELECVRQLRSHQEQLDHDGIMVGVSRQALDETLAYMTDIQSRLFKMERDWSHWKAKAAEADVAEKKPETDRLEEMIALATCLIEQMRWENDAAVKARRNPHDDELYRRHFDLAEGLETTKRCLADAIIDLRLDLNDRIRAVCPFPAYTTTQGSIRINKNGLK